jgi:hypothetical protein
MRVILNLVLFRKNKTDWTQLIEEYLTIYKTKITFAYHLRSIGTLGENVTTLLFPTYLLMAKNHNIVLESRNAFTSSG